MLNLGALIGVGPSIQVKGGVADHLFPLIPGIAEETRIHINVVAIIEVSDDSWVKGGRRASMSIINTSIPNVEATMVSNRW